MIHNIDFSPLLSRTNPRTSPARPRPPPPPPPPPAASRGAEAGPRVATRALSIPFLLSPSPLLTRKPLAAPVSWIRRQPPAAGHRWQIHLSRARIYASSVRRPFVDDDRRGMPAPPHALSPIRPWRGLFLLAAPRMRRGLASTRSCSPAPCGPSGVVGASGGLSIAEASTLEMPLRVAARLESTALFLVVLVDLIRRGRVPRASSPCLFPGPILLLALWWPQPCGAQVLRRHRLRSGERALWTSALLVTALCWS